jgi:hypothetical protein
MGMVGAAMNRGSSFIAELGFYIFVSALILFPIFLGISFKKINNKILIAVGSVPLVIYIPFLVFYVTTHDIYL